jgi:hypothetical protein
VDGKTAATAGGIALALLLTIPLPIYVTHKRLRHEWERYERELTRTGRADRRGSDRSTDADAEEGKSHE